MRKRRFWQITSLFTLLISFQKAQAQEPEIADSFQYPLDNYIPGSYGGRVFGCCSRRHLGEDTKADPLTPVRAIANGMIITGIVSKAHSCYGMVVVIEHILLDGSKVTSIYGHMSNRNGYKPKLSGFVKKGEIIGYVGHSGGRPPYRGSPRKCGNYLDDENGDGDPHLHLGLRLAPAPKNKYGTYIWKYFGYQGYGEDVDYDSRGRGHGGKFTAAKKFIDVYNEKYRDRDNDSYTISQGDCDDNNPAINPGSPDLCDGLDNNCDGEIDENYQPTAERVGLGDACSEGYSDCRQWGVRICSADGRTTVCDAKPKEPELEFCDGLDNDCDGQVDEVWKTGSAADLGKTCTIGSGSCQAGGKWICAPDGRGEVCDAPVITPQAELCDGLDNDCDGEIDEDFSTKGQPCIAGIGACADSGIVVCGADGTATICSVAPKQPDCAGKQCGDDGCGGSCGTCAVNEICNSGLCECVPDCAGKQCGDDPICGFSCGSCAVNEICSNGVCQCVPDCTDKCGGESDGCGGICGKVCTDTWTLIPTTIKPSARGESAMAYDDVRRRTVLFGGKSSKKNNETWEWDGNNWIQKLPNNKPSARKSHAMVYSDADNGVILFGGLDDLGANNETWKWDGNNWIRLFPPTSPSKRQGHRMVYDSARKRIVLFGGWTGVDSNGETWEWDGATWEQRLTVNKPSPRHFYAMTYDSKRHKVILFGGWNGHDFLSDTWEWDGENWQKITVANSPSAVFAATMVYDASHEVSILFGGGVAIPLKTDLNETWEWNGVVWRLKDLAIKPGVRHFHSMIYDNFRKKIVLFGGYISDISRLDDLWEYGTP